MTTGDLKNNLRKLHTELKLVNYSGDLDIEGLSIGKPSAFLPILHFVLTEFSLDLAHYFFSKDYELLGKSDLKFIQVVYRILRDEFAAKAPLTKDQFFTLGFTERKLQFVTSVVQLCRAKSDAIRPRKKKTLTTLNTAKTSKHIKLQAKTSNNEMTDDVISKQITMDTISRKLHQPSVVKSKKFPKDTNVMPVESSSTNGIIEYTSSGKVSMATISVNASNYIKNNSGKYGLGSNTNRKTDKSASQQSRSSSQGSTSDDIDKNECNPMELYNFSVPVIAKENIPPKTNPKIPNLPEEFHNGVTLRFSPIPLSHTKFGQDFQSGCEFTRERIGISGNCVCGRNPVQSTDIDFIKTAQRSGETSLTLDNENVEKLSVSENSVIINCLRTQQEHIEKLEKDSRERAILVQDLTLKNSTLSARIMVLETAVKLLEEKTN